MGGAGGCLPKGADEPGELLPQHKGYWARTHKRTYSTILHVCHLLVAKQILNVKAHKNTCSSSLKLLIPHLYEEQ